MRLLALCTLTAGAVAASVTLAGPAAAAHGGLTVTGLTQADSLVTFKAGAPGTILSEVAVTGLPTGSDLVGIDYRPFTGALYGVAVDPTADTATIVTIDPTTGVAAPVEGAPSLPVSGHVSIDVNPAADALRVVDSTGTNLRIPLKTPRLVVDGSLAYADGKGRPVIGAVAYLNNDNDATTGTTLFDLESAKDRFVRQDANPGTIFPIGPLPVRVGPNRTGFDISTSADGATNWGFVSTYAQGRSTFVEIDLATGGAAATPLGTAKSIGADVHDIAVSIGQGI